MNILIWIYLQCDGKERTVVFDNILLWRTLKLLNKSPGHSRTLSVKYNVTLKRNRQNINIFTSPSSSCSSLCLPTTCISSSHSSPNRVYLFSSGLRTHWDSFEGAGVEGSVDLCGYISVVVIEIFQPVTFGLQRPHGLVEGQSEGPHSVVGQRGFLETTRLFWIFTPELRHQLGKKLLRGLEKNMMRDVSLLCCSSVKYIRYLKAIFVTLINQQHHNL